MEIFDDYLSAFLVIVVAAVLAFALSDPLKEFRKKHAKVFITIYSLAVVYFIVKGIYTGDKFQFGFAALFVLGICLSYLNSKKEKKTE